MAEGRKLAARPSSTASSSSDYGQRAVIGAPRAKRQSGTSSRMTQHVRPGFVCTEPPTTWCSHYSPARAAHCPCHVTAAWCRRKPGDHVLLRESAQPPPARNREKAIRHFTHNSHTNHRQLTDVAEQGFVWLCGTEVRCPPHVANHVANFAYRGAAAAAECEDGKHMEPTRNSGNRGE